MSVEVNIYTPSRRSRSAFLPSGFTGTPVCPLATTVLHYHAAASASITYPRAVCLFALVCRADLVLRRIYPGCSNCPKKEAFCPVQDVTLSPIHPPLCRVATFHKRRVEIIQPLMVSDCYRYLILTVYGGTMTPPLAFGPLIVLPSISRQYR